MEAHELTRMYNRPARRLVCFYPSSATDAFWDQNWADQDPAAIASRDTSFVVGHTRRHLPAGSRILEGGSGASDKVYGLVRAGFDAVGVDFARQTIERLQRSWPDLRFEHGDVRSLRFPDNNFDGYWSIGLIEHFEQGFDDILKEAHRVLKPGGVFFCSFPHMSLLKRARARRGAYAPAPPPGSAPPGLKFFQYELDARTVEAALETIGFRVVRRVAYSVEVGLQTDCRGLYEVRPWRWLRGYKGKSVCIRGVRWALHRWLLPLTAWATGYSALVIARKR